MKEAYESPLAEVFSFLPATPIAEDPEGNASHDNGYMDWSLRPEDEDDAG